MGIALALILILLIMPTPTTTTPTIHLDVNEEYVAEREELLPNNGHGHESMDMSAWA